jgi:hypothetical protein
MNTYHLELTATHKSGYVEYDFCIVKASSREEAIESHGKVLQRHMDRPLPVPAGFVSRYSKWASFQLQ